MRNQEENLNQPSPNPEASKEQRNDALFKALDKSRKQKKRRIIITVLVIVLVVAIALTVTVSVLRRNVRQKFAASDDDILSYSVKTGTISTLISGSGTLSNVDTETIEVPAGVELTEILVENGQTVKEGQLLATADMSTVQSAMSDLQSEINTLDTQIAKADGDKASTRITAGVPGRLKILYGEEGQKVEYTVEELEVPNPWWTALPPFWSPTTAPGMAKRSP